MTTARDIEKIVCHRCCAVLDVCDNFCRHCGQPLRDVVGPCRATAGAGPDRSGGRLEWTQHRWVVLAALFLVLGPMALPMLWRSRRFSPTWKIILTSLVLGLSVGVLWMVWYVAHQVLEPLRKLGELKGF